MWREKPDSLHNDQSTSDMFDRILHIPLFRREYAQYWDNPKSVGNGFVLRLLLVLSIGTSLYPNSQISLRSSVRQWIYAAVSWLSAPFEKSRLNLNGLQIYCLLLIARQVNAVESDLVSAHWPVELLSPPSLFPEARADIFSAQICSTRVTLTRNATRRGSPQALS